MAVEIEAKLKVRSHEPVRRKLSSLGAELIAEQTQNDCYFDNAESVFARTDKCLRLRREKAGRNEKIILTYKGAKEQKKFKTRCEIQSEVADGNAVEKLLCELGYQKALVIRKKRQLWHFSRCEVALDYLRELGRFVEIEGPNERVIANAQKKLGLSDLPNIKESYAHLIGQKLRPQRKR